MILYDQDFNFIGMSAETLTFLGYEDIDEFTSMHNDFADLFVKKEGFIHKFENFSWIHYILYSGAANKKAYVRQKNGSEAPVDITIKEVFLNHTYEGLRKIYSVKLINENFTKISKTDVHDNRSKKSSEYSLSKLTKDPIDLPVPPVESEAPSIPEPVDFKLDMPDIPDMGETASDVPAASTAEPQTEESAFLLNIPSLDEINETKPAQDQNAEPEAVSTENDDIFKLDIFATPEKAPEAAPEMATETEPEKSESMFDTLHTPVSDQKEEIPHISFGEEKEKPATHPAEAKETKSALFSFDLLKKEDEATPLPQEEKAREEEELQPFSFDLFKKRETSATEESVEAAPEQTGTDSVPLETNKDALIDQIKNDIAEIDSETEANLTEQHEAAEKLQQILAESLKEERCAPEVKPTEPEEFMPERAPSSETTSATLFSRPQKSDHEQTFEQTLQDVFQVPKSPEATQNKRNSEQKLNHLNLSSSDQESKLSVTKESLKSQDPDSEQETALDLPKLGNLGLDHEEELDFIEEFLDDTAASLSLAEEYLKLEDYDNIKYSLIKISSSAEILHFEQILDHTRAMSQQCEAQARDALQQELEALKKTVARYKEYYATIVA